MGSDTSSWRPQRNGQLHVAENSFTLTTYVSPFKANTSANWNAVSRQMWPLKPSASKTISSVFHLHNTSATRKLSVYLDGQQSSTFSMSATQPILGDSRPYAVLQRTLDKDCRQAEEPKQFVNEASRFHLGRQRQHSAVICSGALLFSSSVLLPSLVTLCSHKLGRCAVELCHAPHLWYPLFYTSPMASSALQH